MKLYIWVSNDELQLPMIIDKSASALAEKLGVPKNKIFCSLWGRRQNPDKKFFQSNKFVFDETEIPDEDTELVTDEMWKHYKEWKNEQRRNRAED